LHLLLSRHRSLCHPSFFSLFFFNDTATTELYPLSLHDALPISRCRNRFARLRLCRRARRGKGLARGRHRQGEVEARLCASAAHRSEEHTSELQSLTNLVCRLLLEKKNKILYKDAS